MFSASVALIAPAVGVGLGAGLAETVEALGAGVGADVEPVSYTHLTLPTIYSV